MRKEKPKQSFDRVTAAAAIIIQIQHLEFAINISHIAQLSPLFRKETYTLCQDL